MGYMGLREYREAGSWEHLLSRARGSSAPIMVSIEITHRCNFDCPYCYNRVDASSDDAATGELSSDAWKDILLRLAKAGVWFVEITGGEPLVRKDALDILDHARRCGMWTCICTNGSLVSTDVAHALRESGVSLVKLTVPAVSAEAFRACTRRPSLRDEVISVPYRLRRVGLPVRVSCTLTTLNLHELDTVMKFALRFDPNAAFNGVLVPHVHGEPRVPDMSLRPEELAEAEYRWGIQQRRAERCECRGHTSSIRIGPSGTVYSCVYLRSGLMNADSPLFPESYSAIARQAAGRLVYPQVCETCADKLYCDFCPGHASILRLSKDKTEPFFCLLAAARRSLWEGEDHA
jgi:MoaA/NifB/PqqE/SkfB family radical SAM enzyme